jgi:tRNA (guanine37-N1)-methyltransferase
MVSSYDIIGEIAVVENPDDSRVVPRDLARKIVKTHPRVKTVLLKTGERSGEFRLRKMRKLFGKDTETVHTEHGFSFRVDPTKVYFSPREGTERERIASKVRPGETVMVLFAGVGPYGIVIAGKQPRVRKVYQVEINPKGFEYMKQNISMNKLSHLVVPLLGDAREACRKFMGKCDRVVMPLPREGHLFLDSALGCLKDRGFVHFYAVGRHAKGASGNQAKKQIFGEAEARLRESSRKARRSLRINSRRKVLPFSPGGWKVCIDAELKSGKQG